MEDIRTRIKEGRKAEYVPVFPSIYDALASHATSFPDKEAVVSVDVDSGMEERVKYAQFFSVVRKTASWLQGYGVAKGSRVAFLMHNTADVLVLELACGILGASSVPLDSKRDALERKAYKLQDTNAQLLYCRGMEEGIEDIRGQMPSLKIIETGGDHGLIQMTQGAVEISREACVSDWEGEYVVLYTSGTTAQPKGVLLSGVSCAANAEGIIRWQNMTEHDRFLIVLPLHHINSTIMSLATILAGGTVVLSSRYSGSRFWKTVEEHKPTITSVVPTILHDLLVRHEQEGETAPALCSLRRILIGSAPVLPGETLRFMDAFGIPVVQGYGQTETALRVTGVPVDLSPEDHRRMVAENSIGAELAFCNVAVLKEDGTEAKEDEEGEICIRGPVISDGYLNNPEETAGCFKNGWYWSGDIGSFKEHAGKRFFFVKGRKKEILIKGGVNISPAAVEDKILSSIPEIDEVCVVGYEDLRMGEEVAAVVRFKSGYSTEDEKRMAKEIVKKGQEEKLGLTSYEAPQRVFVVREAMPKTSTGKIQRVEVKKMVWQLMQQGAGIACRRILPNESEVLAEAVEINNMRWGIPATIEEFQDRVKNGWLIGAFDASGTLEGTVSMFRLSRSALHAAKTWEEATGNGTSSTNDPSGDVLVCSSISVRERRKEPVIAASPETEELVRSLAGKAVDAYVASNLDSVLRFHRKPKGGMSKGAEATKILEGGRLEDRDAVGYNVLMEYPALSADTKIAVTQGAPASTALVEYAMQIATELGCKSVVAFSRPAQLRLHILKALDFSVPFLPRDEGIFQEFAEQIRKERGA